LGRLLGAPSAKRYSRKRINVLRIKRLTGAAGIPLGLLSVLAIVIVLPALSSCGSEKGVDPPPPPDPPILLSLSKTVLSVGDTLSIVGEKFAPTPSQNRVRFANSLASVPPHFVTADSLTDSLAVVVPEWATSGPLQVISSGATSDPVSVEILRAVGDVWVVGGDAAFDFKLPGTGAGEEYVLIPYSASTSGVANYFYTVTPGTTSVYPAPPAMSAGSGKGTVTFPLEFELSIREQAIDYIQRHAGDVRPLERAPQATAAAPMRVFNVLKCATCSTSNPANYNQVTANLVYTGSNTLIYADVNQPTGSFTQTDYDDLGLQFDTQTYDTTTSYFGTPSDIGDAGKVVILFTPQVNDLTPDGTASQGFISGFFLVNDLAPNFFSTSNGTEMFYAMVPDPNNQYGNTFSKNLVKGLMPATLAHEFEHMISFGFRFVTAGGGTTFGFTQLTWLEEGMAHMSEDLNGFTQSNQNRVNLYLPDPGAVSLMGGDSLEQRGGIFLFLRYLGDQLGEDIFKPMTQSACKGIPCVESATGTYFFTSVADYLATLFLDGAGVTLNPRYRYTSDVNLNVLANAIDSRTVSEGMFSSWVRGAGGDYYDMSGFQPPATNFRVTGGVRVIVARTN